MNRSFVVAPSLAAGVRPSGEIRLTRKFLSGMQLYVDHWDGPVTLLIEPDSNEHSGNLDDVWVKVNERPFQVTVARFDSEQATQTMKGAGLVMGGPDQRMNHAAAMCREAGVPFVMVTEQSLKTRIQIIESSGAVFWRRWRRRLWAISQEASIVKSIRLSAGLQCNGTPTYEAYRELNGNTLLYFDNRVSEQMLPSGPALANRSAIFGPLNPLRLAFSGRLDVIKGVDHLVKVAIALRDLGVSFKFDIYGDGPLSSSIKQEILDHGLEDVVMLRGTLDFASELMPRICSEVDLFVCCHRQGDPSCTYLETMACGVPIVGYANDAFAGLLRRCKGGLSVPIDDWNALASEITRLARAPEELVVMAQSALEFARKHTFESEFHARIAHMKRLLERCT